MHQRILNAIFTGIFILGFSQTAAAADPQIFASDLQLPSRIVAIGGRNLLVTETGAAPNSGRVSLIDAGGTRHTVIDQLPSGLAAPDFAPDGPNGIALSGRTLFVSNGEGDSHVNGPRPGSLQLNPNGPSSPLFSTILRFRFSDDVASLAAGFVLTPTLQGQLADGRKITLDNGLGQIATVELFAAFRIDRPDPVTIYRNTHIYGLALSGDDPQTLFADDAGNNAIWKVSNRAETPRLVARFPAVPNPLFPPQPPPFSEAVPTSVHWFKGKLLVTLFRGAPFVPGTSEVSLLDPETGATVPFITGLNSAIDVLPRRQFHSNTDFLVLEYSKQLTVGAPGRLLFYRSGKVETLADGLVTPTSMAIDEGRGALFITDQSNGRVLSLPLP